MIVALGFAGFFLSIAIPNYVRSNAEFVVMQVGGATLTLGYGLIHLEISTWKLINELPAISAGIIFAVGPMVVM